MAYVAMVYLKLTPSKMTLILIILGCRATTKVKGHNITFHIVLICTTKFFYPQSQIGEKCDVNKCYFK